MKPRRPFRALFYLAVFVAATAYVIFSAARQPAFSNGTLIGETTAGIFGKGRPRVQKHATYYFRHRDGAWRILDASQITDENFVSCSISTTPYRTGVWHPIFEVRRVSVHFQDHQHIVQFDPGTRREILIALESAHPGTVPPASLAAYVNGRQSTRHILWLGILGDLSILAAFAAIVFSLVKLRSEIRWRMSGCCAECDYDLTGLAADKCPECGAAINSASSA